MNSEEHIGLLIGAARRRIKQAVGSRVRRYRLTTQQFWILVAIHERPGLSLGELAARLRMDKPTASRIVSALLERNLVEVRSHAADRRRACLHLGPPAAPLGEELHQLAARIRAAVVQKLSTAEQKALGASLRKIIASMDQLQHSDAGTSDRDDGRLPRRRRARAATDTVARTATAPQRPGGVQRGLARPRS